MSIFSVKIVLEAPQKKRAEIIIIIQATLTILWLSLEELVLKSRSLPTGTDQASLQVDDLLSVTLYYSIVPRIND